MPLPLITAASAIVELVAPRIGKWIGGEKGEDVAERVVGVAQAITGTGTPEEALEALKQDAELQAKLKTRLAELELEFESENTARLAEINKTMRAEILSEDPYVRRARPTFLYIIAIAFGAQLIGTTLIGGTAVVLHPNEAGKILTGLAEVIGATIVLYGVAMPVCGVYLSKRSQDKAVAAGHAPTPGLLERLVPGKGG